MVNALKIYLIQYLSMNLVAKSNIGVICRDLRLRSGYWNGYIGTLQHPERSRRARYLWDIFLQ